MAPVRYGAVRPRGAQLWNSTASGDGEIHEPESLVLVHVYLCVFRFQLWFRVWKSERINPEGARSSTLKRLSEVCG